MKKYIPEVLSDSEFVKLELVDRRLLVRILLYTEDLLEIEFLDVYAFNSKFWLRNGVDIESLVSSNEDKYLNDVKKEMSDEGAVVEELKHYSFVGSNGDVLLEVASKKVVVGEISYD